MGGVGGYLEVGAVAGDLHWSCRSVLSLGLGGGNGTNRSHSSRMGVRWGWAIEARGFLGHSGFTLSHLLPLLTWACRREKRFTMKREENLPR